MPKLLLADDSPTTQKVVQLTFADEGIDVVVADDGDTAMELYAHHRPDIVLADINIPGLNGYEVCEAIRKREDNGSTPVILLAGSFEPFDVEEAHRVGASDYLTKPFASIRRLVATVTALLDTAARHDSSAEETVEPNSVPPHPTEPEPASSAEAVSPPENEAGPGPTLPPEPDPYATDDIEHLINQSFVETVEMPHTVAERMMSQIASEKAEQRQQPEQSDAPRDEAAFDDELIETTFASEPTESVETDEHVQDENQVDESREQSVTFSEFTDAEPEASASGYSEAFAPEYRVEPLGEEFVPPETDVATLSPENAEISANADTSDLSQAPTEEFQIDQSGDEAYFEPATEIVEQQSEILSPPAEEYAPHETRGAQTVEPVEEHVEPSIGKEYVASDEHAAPEMMPEPALAAVEPEAGETAEQTPVSTPWDSVAVPQPARFELDESNLLELPAGFGTRPNDTETGHEADHSSIAAELAPEIVDEIARATASQISEELVREIAQRIVPKVVEEVMARRRGENIEQ